MNNQTCYNDTTNSNDESEILNRNSQDTMTCYNKNYKYFIPAFSSQFQDSFFYANVIQLFLVVLIYRKVGQGKYWKILLYAAISGGLGGIVENMTVAYICLPSHIEEDGMVVPFLIAEVFWCIQQYSVPLLNLIKIKTFAKDRITNVLKTIISVLLVPFLFFRGYIGYERMKKGYLVDDKISELHGYAFSMIAIADIICTLSIIFVVNKYNKRLTTDSYNIYQQVKRSSYMVLLCIDVVQFVLAIFNIIANTIMKFIPHEVTIPFQCIMSNFILILAVDGLLLKYDGKESSQVMTPALSRNSKTFSIT